MPVSNKMTIEELDAAFLAAKSKEDFVAHCEDLLEQSFDDCDDDSFFDECDAHHAAYGDKWTQEDEAALEQWEIDKRERLAIKNEY